MLLLVALMVHIANDLWRGESVMLCHVMSGLCMWLLVIVHFLLPLVH